MKIKIFCLLIVTVFSCNKVTAESSADDSDTITRECLEEYLEQKGNIKGDFPTREWSFRCRTIAVTALRILNKSVESQINSTIHGSDAACLIKQFKNLEILDLLVKLEVVEQSKLSESEMETRTDETITELRNALVNAALKCRTDQEKFVEIFNGYLGIKSPRNVTLSALEHNFCFAKFVADNHLLPMENIDLNPNGIVTDNVNCDAIINEEREREEADYRNKLKDLKENVIECILEEYRKGQYFQSHISELVVGFLEFPKDIEDAETEKLKATVGQIAYIGFLCSKADTQE